MVSRTGYFARRQHLIYYAYVDKLVRGLAHDANSLLDVGTHNASYLESFDWIDIKHALDIRRPYHSKSVDGIEIDFLEFQPSEKYDFCTCLQTLEHVPDVTSFVKKLKDVSDRLLISVPYKWPSDAHLDHIHDPVDEEKVSDWFGRVPDYSIVVTEPLNRTAKGRRLIAYFHGTGKMRPLHEYRGEMRRRS